MTRAELSAQINSLLADGPFTDEEMAEWRKKIPKMSEADLAELFSLLKQKQQVLNDADQLFVDMAEELAAEQQKKAAAVPDMVNIEDMKISDLADLFSGKDLISMLAKTPDMTRDLEKYFSEIDDEDRQNVIDYFDSFLKALSSNQESIFGSGSLSISKWLSLYDQFNDSRERKGLDRLNFANQNQEIKKLKPENREILLRLLKVYDYLLNPTVSEAVRRPTEAVKAKTVKTPSTEDFSLPAKKAVMASIEDENNTKRIADLTAMAARYPENSLQRKAVEDEIQKLSKK